MSLSFLRKPTRGDLPNTIEEEDGLEEENQDLVAPTITPPINTPEQTRMIKGLQRSPSIANKQFSSVHRGVSFYVHTSDDAIESSTNTTSQNKLDVMQRRTAAISKAEALKKIMAKGKFKSDCIAEKALRILIYKKRDQRNTEDLSILQKATCEMTFFSELLAKKSNIMNNVHLNLCKAMNFEYAKKGSIVFYTGDIPDRFYILLKGEVAVMLRKKQEEIDKLKKACPAIMPSELNGNKDEKKKSFIQQLSSGKFKGVPRASQHTYRSSRFLRMSKPSLQSNALISKDTELTISEGGELNLLKKEERKKNKQKLMNQKQNIVQPLDAQKLAKQQMMSNLLPSEQVLFDRKQKKINESNRKQSVSSMLKMPKIGQVGQATRPSSSAVQKQSNDVSQKEQKSSEGPTATANAAAAEQGDKNKDVTSPTEVKKPKETQSYISRKLKVDLQKVMLGVRLNRIFQSDVMANLNLGGPKLMATIQNASESFSKEFPKLSLIGLENAAHFYDENVFRYFHAVNLGEGRVFGDLGILTKKPRAATIVCQEDCYFGVLGLEDYSRILMEQKKKKMSKAIKFLESTMDTSLSIEKMSKLTQFFEKKQFVAGERIYSEGDPVQAIYLIKKGEVELFRKIHTEYGINAQQVIDVSIAIIGPKTYFGEDEAISNTARKYTAVARVDTNVLMMKKKDFTKLMSEISEMQGVLKEMSQKKEMWRDDIYRDIISTRMRIKNIRTLSNKPSKHSLSTSKKSKGDLSNSSVGVMPSRPLSRQNSQHNSDEQVKKQILKMEAESFFAAETHNKLNRRNEEPLFKDSPQSSPKHQQQQQQFSLNSFDSVLPKRIASAKQQTKLMQLNEIDTTTASSEWIEGRSPRIKPSTPSSSSSMSKLSPRLQQIIQNNPEFVQKVNMKEISSIIHKKKHILSHSLQGKELSAIEAFRETRDVCIGSNDITRKLERVAERRNEIKRQELFSDQSSGQQSQKRSHSQDLMFGKMSSDAQIGTMLTALKKKHSEASTLNLTAFDSYQNYPSSPSASPGPQYQKALSSFFGVQPRSPSGGSFAAFSSALKNNKSEAIIQKPASMFYTPNIRMNVMNLSSPLQISSPRQTFTDASMRTTFGGLLGNRFSLTKDKSITLNQSRLTNNNNQDFSMMFSTPRKNDSKPVIGQHIDFIPLSPS